MMFKDYNFIAYLLNNQHKKQLKLGKIICRQLWKQLEKINQLKNIKKII